MLRRRLELMAGVLRRGIPTRLLPGLVRARASLDRRRDSRWQIALAQMRFVLGDEAEEAEVQRQARAHLVRAAWRAESRYHPDIATRQQVQGGEHLRAAMSEGKGCFLSFLHHADYEASFGSLARAGFPHWVMANADIVSGRARPWVEQTRRLLLHVPGAMPFDVATGSAGIRERISRGECVAVALDVPGTTYFRFLGKDLLMSSSGARIAFDLGTPIVPMTFSENPSTSVGPADILLAPALHPRDFSTAEELLAAVGTSLEASVLRWPAAVAWQDTEFLVTDPPDAEPSSGNGNSDSRRRQVTSVRFKPGPSILSQDDS